MAKNPFLAKTGIVTGNLTVTNTNIIFGTDVNISSLNVQVQNSTSNSIITRSFVAVSNASGTTNVTPTQIQIGNSSVSANLSAGQLLIGSSLVNSTTISLGSFSANSSTINTSLLTVGANVSINTTSFGIVNSIVSMTLNNSGINLINSTANAFLNPALLWVPTVNAMVVNSATLQVGSSFTANSTVVNAPSLVVTGTTNVSTIGVATELDIGTTTVANGSGIYTAIINASTVNATSYSIGTNFTANSTLTNTAALNVVGPITSNSANVTNIVTVGSNAIINTTGLYHTGLINASSFAVGTGFTANSTVVNAALINLNTANVATNLLVGSNVALSTGSLFIGNSSVNASLNSTALAINGNVLLPSQSDISIVIGDGSSVIPNGVNGKFLGPFGFNFNIIRWCILGKDTTVGNQINLDVYRTTYNNFDAGVTHPVASDIISSNSTVNNYIWLWGNSSVTSTQVKNNSTAPSLGGWTNKINFNDILAFNCNNVIGFTQVVVTLTIQKTS